jgi:cellulose synthase/poly-beta-1,6-N-acetylglucosamine synthase-like glycosyltransferase
MAHVWVWALFWWVSAVFSALVIFNIAASLLYPIVYPVGRRVGDDKIDNYLVVVVTVGTPSVLPSLREVVDNLKRLGLRFVIVSSNPLPLEGVDVLLVPREEDGTKYRAIRWFVKNYARDDTWYVFLDDDSYPLDDNFLREIPYWERRGRLVGNGLVVPRLGRSRIAYAVDWVRYFDGLTRYRSTHLLGLPIHGLHGELLIIRGDVLKRLWPSMPESVTEDFMLAMFAIRHGIKTFQVSTRVSIKSPNSLRDLFRQRRRWGHVVVDAIRTGNVVVIAFLATGILSSPLFAWAWPHTSVISIVAGAYYITAYLYGSIKARVNPIATFLASLVDLTGFLSGMTRQMRFTVIDKT